MWHRNTHKEMKIQNLNAFIPGQADSMVREFFKPKNTEGELPDQMPQY